MHGRSLVDRLAGVPTSTNRPIVRRRRVLELQPVAGATGAVARAQPLRHDAFEPHLAGVLEHDVAAMRVELHPRQRFAQAALRNRNSSFVLDGEAVLLGVDGRSDFDALHSRRHDAEVEFYAFDILVSDGEDLRGLPLSMRKASLSRLLARRVDGIFLSDFEQGEIGPDLFRHACLMGLEGMVSKHRESLYRGGRFRHWVKIKNRAHPAFGRVQDQF